MKKENNKKIIGGEKTFKLYGKEHMVKIGKKGHKTQKKIREAIKDPKIQKLITEKLKQI